MNFALSFGHVHVPDGNASERGWIVEALTLGDHGKSPGHSNGSHPDDLCPICLATAALATALAPAPPAILPPFDVIIIDQPAPPVYTVAALFRAPFQSRGPPVS